MTPVDKPQPLLWPFPQWDWDTDGNFRMVQPPGKPKSETKRERLERLADEIGESKW